METPDPNQGSIVTDGRDTWGTYKQAMSSGSCSLDLYITYSTYSSLHLA